MAITVHKVEPDAIIPMGGKGKTQKGDSWGEIINRIADYTAEEASAYFGKMAAAGGYMQGRTLRELMVARAIESFIEAPNANLWNILMERSEGKVAEKVDINQVTAVEIRIRKTEDKNEG